MIGKRVGLLYFSVSVITFCHGKTMERDIDRDLDEGPPSGIKEKFAVSNYCTKSDKEGCKGVEFYFLGSRRNNKCTRKFYWISAYATNYEWPSGNCHNLGDYGDNNTDMIFRPQISESEAEANWVMEVAKNINNFTHGDGYLFVDRYETKENCLAVNKTGGKNCWTKEKLGECQYYTQVSHDDCFLPVELEEDIGKGYLLCQGVYPFGETEYEKARCKPTGTIPAEQPDVQGDWIRLGKVNAYPCRNDSKERYMWLNTDGKNEYGVLAYQCEELRDKMVDLGENEFGELSYSLLEDSTDDCLEGLENLFRTWHIETPVVLKERNGTYPLLTWNSDKNKIDVVKVNDEKSASYYMGICVADKEKELTEEEADALLAMKLAK